MRGVRTNTLPLAKPDNANTWFLCSLSLNDFRDFFFLAISLTGLVNIICTRCQRIKIAQTEVDTAAQDVQFK